MRRVLVVLVIVFASVLALAGPVAAAAVVRVHGNEQWTVKWSLTWNAGDAGRSYDLDAGKVREEGDVVLSFGCLRGPDSCSWSIYDGGGAGYWKRPSKPTKAECRTGWATDDPGHRYRDKLIPSGSSKVDEWWATPDGTWLCTKTDADRYGRIRLLHWPTKHELWFRFQYSTWQK